MAQFAVAAFDNLLVCGIGLRTIWSFSSEAAAACTLLVHAPRSLLVRLATNFDAHAYTLECTFAKLAEHYSCGKLMELAPGS